jgi:hypothetical protein
MLPQLEIASPRTEIIPERKFDEARFLKSSPCFSVKFAHLKISSGLYFQNCRHNTAKIQHFSISKVAFDYLRTFCLLLVCCLQVIENT